MQVGAVHQVWVEKSGDPPGDIWAPVTDQAGPARGRGRRFMVCPAYDTRKARINITFMKQKTHGMLHTSNTWPTLDSISLDFQIFF